MSARAARARPAAAAAAAALLLAAALAGAARADDDLAALTATELLDQVRALEREPVGSLEADRARWERVRARTTAFLDRFPDDRDHRTVALIHAMAALRLGRADDAVTDATAYLDRYGEGGGAATGLYLRGLAHAERGADLLALADLDRAAARAEGSDLRAQVRYARAQVHIRGGAHAAAIEELRALVVELPGGSSLAKRADQDLREQVLIGGQAPALAELDGDGAGGVVVLVLRRAGDPTGEAALAEARASLAGGGAPSASAPPGEPAAPGEASGGARVLDLVVEGFADPRARALRTPALPRIYVIGPRAGGAGAASGARVVRAAGVRGAAIRAAVERR